jgi:YD repeat-containing protein
MRSRSSRPRILRLSWLLPLFLLLTIVLPSPVVAAGAQAAATATTSVATRLAATTLSGTGRTTSAPAAASTSTKTTTAGTAATTTRQRAHPTRRAGATPLVASPSGSGPGVLPGYPLLTYRVTDRMQVIVNLATGNVIIHATDLVIQGTGLAVVVDRWYNNVLNAVQTVDGSFGIGWMINAGPDVLLQTPSSNPTFVGPSNYQVAFTANPDGSYSAQGGIDATLVKNQDSTFTLTFQASGLRYQFTNGGVLTALVDRNGNALTYTYGNPNDGNAYSTSLAAITDTQGRAVNFLYNVQGYIGTMTDPSGRQASYVNDGIGQLDTFTDFAGKQTQYSYNGFGDLTSITDPAGHVTQLGYNTEQITSLTLGVGSPGAGAYTFAYNSGNTVVTDPNGHATTYTFDGQGRTIQVTDALGNSVQQSWTSDNHVQTSTDAYGKVTQYGYDAHNNLTSVQLPTGASTSAVYGAVTNTPYCYVPTSSTDAQGNTTSYGYDGKGNLTSTTDALASQNQTQLFYNANGTVNHIIDARGNTTSYGYDGKGNLTSITPPALMGGTTIGYDGLSRVTSVTDGKGQQRSYTYDPLDRVTALNYPAYAAGNVSYSYDADGNVLTATDSTGTTSYSYDAQNRQTQKTLPGGGSFSYGYDAVGNLTTLTDAATVPSSPLAVTYGYNALNLVTSLADPSGTTSFGYDQDHQRTSTTYPDGVVQSQSYDPSGRLTSITGKNGGTTLTSFAYSYTKPGGGDTLLPWGVTETTTSPNNTTVTNATVANSYDALNRISKWLVTNTSSGAVLHDYTYQYDGTSNRTQIIADPVNSSGQIVSDPSQGLPHSNENDLSFTAASALSQIQPYSPQGQAQTPVAYSYDTAGNQTGNNGGGTGKPLTISYLPTNQTQSISDINQNPETMTWAGAGQAERVKRTWTDQGTNYTATYVWSQLGLSGYTNNGINEPTQTSSVTSWIIRAPDGTPIAQRYSSGQEYYYLFDGQGNVIAMEDPGVIQASWDYCPTGNNPAVPGTQPTTVGMANPIRQGGVPYDDPTKMYVNPDGVITPDYSNVPTQGPAIANGDCQSGGGSAEGGQTSFAAEMPAGGGGESDTVTSKGDCGTAQLTVTDEQAGGFISATLTLMAYFGPIGYVNVRIGFQNGATTTYIPISSVNQSRSYTTSFEGVYTGTGAVRAQVYGYAIVVPFEIPVLTERCRVFTPVGRIRVT